MEWSLMDVESELISLLQKDHIPRHQEFIWGDLPMAAHAVVITMTEDMIEAMMIGTTIADHTEEVVEVEEDGELLKTGIRFTEGGHLLLTIVVEDIDHVPDLGHTHLVAIKHEVESFLKPTLEFGYCLWTIFFIVSCLKSEQCLVKLGDFYTFYDDYFWWS